MVHVYTFKVMLAIGEVNNVGLTHNLLQYQYISARVRGMQLSYTVQHMPYFGYISSFPQGIAGLIFKKQQLQSHNDIGMGNPPKITAQTSDCYICTHTHSHTSFGSFSRCLLLPLRMLGDQPVCRLPSFLWTTFSLSNLMGVEVVKSSVCGRTFIVTLRSTISL